MGYKRKLYKFKFEDPDLEGLEVVARPMTLDAMLDISDDLEALQGGTANRAAILKMADLLVSCMVSWTVEDDDGTLAPLPVTGKDLLTEDAALGMAILTEWGNRLARVAPPLPGSSSGGENSALEQSIPMEPLSPSQPSWRARLILGLAERFGQRPDTVGEWDGSVLRLLEIERLGTRQEGGES